MSQPEEGCEGMSNTRGDSQAKILEYIQRFIKEVGYPPSVREICNATGLKSTSTVHGHLLRLQKGPSEPGRHETPGHYGACGPGSPGDRHGNGGRSHCGLRHGGRPI